MASPCLLILAKELGHEAFDLIPQRSLASRKLLNQFYPEPVEVQPFKELSQRTRRGYLSVTGAFLVYLFSISQDYGYEQPVLEEGWKEQISDLEKQVIQANRKTVIDAPAKASIKKLGCSFQINGSFSNPMITYLILICLDQSVYESADLKTAVFKSTTVIQGILSKIIYTARLYTMAYLCHLAEHNGVENTRMFIRQRLTSASDNHFSELHSLRSKLKHHNYNLVSAYKPIQDVDPNTIMIRQTAINIPTLRRAFSHALGRLEERPQCPTGHQVFRSENRPDPCRTGYHIRQNHCRRSRKCREAAQRRTSVRSGSHPRKDRHGNQRLGV